MGLYRKKPIVIEAVQWTGDILDFQPIHDMAGDHPVGVNGKNLIVFTLEGQMLAQPGDWIIKGVKGELYPCKPDIFDATYEPA
jgi:hypothetical protein